MQHNINNISIKNIILINKKTNLSYGALIDQTDKTYISSGLTMATITNISLG